MPELPSDAVVEEGESETVKVFDELDPLQPDTKVETITNPRMPRHTPERRERQPMMPASNKPI